MPNQNFTHSPGSYLVIEDKRLRHELDKDISTIYKAHKHLNDLAIKGPDTGFRVNSGETSVTGTATVASGLPVVRQVVASVDAGATPVNYWISARVNPTDKSKIDLFVYKPTAANDTTPILSTVQTMVKWWVTGS